MDPPPKLDHGQPRTNPFHFIESVIDYHQSVRRDDPDDDPPDPQPPPPDWFDHDDDFDYKEALEELHRTHGPDWEQAG